MILKKHILSPEEMPFPQTAFPSKGVFFDIETTGLSHRNSHLYMIGAIYQEDQQWHFIQWFLQRPTEERDVLEAFADFLKSFDTIIHYNGQTFDVPYLQGRYAHWELPDPFMENEGLVSLDLFRKLCPMKHFLQMDSMKQKAMELLLGFPRQDERDGKELIDVYHRYLQTGGQEELKLLLLHNHDDLLGMLTIYRFHLYLTETLQHPLLRKLDIQDSLLHLHLETQKPSPVSLQFESETAALSIRDKYLTLVLKGCRGCFRHYYPNYRDYFYLPLEDTAIHKSVGVYVDPSCRQKAKADTCYTKKEGLFFPQPSSVLNPDFRKDCRKGSSWFSADQLPQASEEELIQLAREQINACLRSKK